MLKAFQEIICIMAGMSIFSLAAILQYAGLSGEGMEAGGFALHG